MFTRFAARLTPLLCAAALVGCGGGGADRSGPFTVQALSAEHLDGTVQAFEAEAFGMIATGDDVINRSAVGTVSLRYEGLVPPGVRILSAVLTLHQAGTFGAPYATLGALLVDHVDLGSELDPLDYGGGLLEADIGVLARDGAPGPKTLDVTAAVQADVSAGRMHSDFRLHFENLTDVDGAIDAALFNNRGDAVGDGTIPQLLIVYQP